MSNVELETLRSEWDALWERTPEATTFQSPRWLLPWWHHFGTGFPLVAVNRQVGQLIGVLPLYILPAERKVLPIGAGVTDYTDALGESVGLLEAALATVDTDIVQSCDLVDVQPGSALANQTVQGWTAEWRTSETCPVLALPRIPKLARRKLNMSRNRAVRAGGWRVQVAEVETIDAYLNTLICLHQARWNAQDEPGVMSDVRVQAFWREAAPALWEGGLLRLQSLTIAGKAAATIAALLAPSRIFFYISGFDQAQAFVSPGTILLGAMLEQAGKEGRSEAHFLRGRESYKYVWGAEDRFNWLGRYVPNK